MRAAMLAVKHTRGLLFALMENRTQRFARHYALRTGVAIKDLRTRLGLTQADLAERLTDAGYPTQRATVAKMENGARPTSVEEVAAVAAVLDVPITYVLPGTLDENAVDGEKRSLAARLAVSMSTELQFDEILSVVAKAKQEHARESSALQARLSSLEVRDGE